MGLSGPDRARRLAGIVLPGLLATAMLAACTGGEGRPASDSASAEPTPVGQAPSDDVSGSAAATDLTMPGNVRGTSDTTGGHERGGDIATLLSARTSPPSVDGVERLVFEFDGESVPRYEMAYLEPPYVQCGSGHPVTVAGDAVLQLRLRGTRAHAESAEQILPTVTERDRKLDQPLLRQLILTCDFEGEVEWLLGLTSRLPFRILELESPARLVVDFSPPR